MSTTSTLLDRACGQCGGAIQSALDAFDAVEGEIASLPEREWRRVMLFRWHLLQASRAIQGTRLIPEALRVLTNEELDRLGDLAGDMAEADAYMLASVRFVMRMGLTLSDLTGGNGDG